MAYLGERSAGNAQLLLNQGCGSLLSLSDPVIFVCFQTKIDNMSDLRRLRSAEIAQLSLYQASGSILSIL